MRAKLFTALFISFLSFVALAQETTEPPKPPANDFVPAGDVVPTIFYKPIVKADNTKCTEADLRDILDVEGKVIVRVCHEIHQLCAMQGACFIESGDKVFSLVFMAKIDNIYRFKETKDDRCPFGYGVKNICLDPFFSVAADLAFHKVGDVIFMPELIGLRLPNNEYHDGFLIVRDRGEAVKGEHRFDFFTGFIPFADQSNPFSVLRLDIISTRVPYFKVTGRTADMVKRSRSYPRVPKRSWPPAK